MYIQESNWVDKTKTFDIYIPKWLGVLNKFMSNNKKNQNLGQQVIPNVWNTLSTRVTHMITSPATNPIKMHYELEFQGYDVLLHPNHVGQPWFSTNFDNYIIPLPNFPFSPQMATKSSTQKHWFFFILYSTQIFNPYLNTYVALHLVFFFFLLTSTNRSQSHSSFCHIISQKSHILILLFHPFMSLWQFWCLFLTNSLYNKKRNVAYFLKPRIWIQREWKHLITIISDPIMATIE